MKMRRRGQGISLPAWMDVVVFVSYAFSYLPTYIHTYLPFYLHILTIYIYVRTHARTHAKEPPGLDDVNIHTCIRETSFPVSISLVWISTPSSVVLASC